MSWPVSTRIQIDLASSSAFLKIRWASMLLNTLHWISMGLICGICRDYAAFSGSTHMPFAGSLSQTFASVSLLRNVLNLSVPRLVEPFLSILSFSLFEVNKPMFDLKS